MAISPLGNFWKFPYRALVIAFLRIVGLLNAAAWFGVAIVVLFATEPAASSAAMEGLLGSRNSPYFSAAIAHLFIKRFFYFQIPFAVIALLHLIVERLYLGKWSQKAWFGLVIALLAVCLLNCFWLQPKLDYLHKAAFAVNFSPQQRQSAEESYRLWHVFSKVLNILGVGGLALYLWRVANPQDSTRFVVGAAAPFNRSERL